MKKVKTPKPVEKKIYLAPIHVFIQDNQILRAPGISSQMHWNPLPGTSCYYPQNIHLEQENENSPDAWTSVALYPVKLSSLTPDQNTAVIIYQNKVIHVSEIPNENKPLKFKIIPNDFFFYFQPHIEQTKSQKYAEYFPQDYRIEVSLPVDSQIPPTWEENRVE